MRVFACSFIANASPMEFTVKSGSAIAFLVLITLKIMLYGAKPLNQRWSEIPTPSVPKCSSTTKVMTRPTRTRLTNSIKAVTAKSLIV